VERPSGAAPPLRSGASGQTAPGPLRLHVERSGGRATVVSLSGELDLSTVPRLQTCLQEHQRAKATTVILDLSQVTFIDSSGIGALIRAFKDSENGRRLLTVIAADTQVERVLQLSGIDKALPLFGDRAAALATLAKAPS
jgi:anti-sigma B factor antagonist